MTSLATTLCSPLRHVPTDTTSFVNAARARIAGDCRDQRDFAQIVGAMRTSASTAMTAAGQEPPRQEIDPDERRWRLEWERRNIED